MPKKQPRRRKDIPREFNDGQWTLARMRAFAMSALRRAAWPQRHKAVERAYVRDGINPATGKKCKLHKCELCGWEGPKGKFHADHPEPVIPIENNWHENPDNFLGYDWNQVLQRLWVEKDHYDILCHNCHKAKTAEEKAERAQYKKDHAL